MQQPGKLDRWTDAQHRGDATTWVGGDGRGTLVPEGEVRVALRTTCVVSLPGSMGTAIFVTLDN